MAKNTKRCDCIKQVNEQLKEQGINAVVATEMSFNFTKMKGSVELFLPMRYREKKKKGDKLPSIVCTFCPICGKKIPRE